MRASVRIDSYSGVSKQLNVDIDGGCVDVLGRAAGAWLRLREAAGRAGKVDQAMVESGETVQREC